MKTLADYTTPALILPQVQIGSASEVLAELMDKLCEAGRLSDREAFLDAVMVREQLSPTSCSPGWALPHARLRDLPQLSFALAQCSRPLAWVGDQTVRVKAIWLFAVPELETKAYLNLIASVARFSQNSSLLDQLMRAPDASSVYEVLRKVPLRVTPSPQVAASAA